MAALQQRIPAALTVNIAAIPEEGLAFQVEVMAVDLHVPPDAERELPTPITVRGRLTRAAEQAYFQGTIRGTLMVPCSRCIEIIPSDFVTEVRVVFLPPSTRLDTEGEEGVDSEDELDLYMHDGITLDLQPLVHDHVLLASPVQPLCRPECAGLCQVCGENRNEVRCACQAEAGDPRFALLQQLRSPKRS